MLDVLLRKTHQNFEKQRLALVPPKPKEFVNAASTLKYGAMWFANGKDWLVVELKPDFSGMQRHVVKIKVFGKRLGI